MKPRPGKPRPSPAPPIADEDAALFRAAVGEVQPVSDERVVLRRPPPPAEPRQTRADERAAMAAVMSTPLAELAVEASDPLAYASDGVSQRVLRRLGRGEFSVGADLDLHGLTQPMAAQAIAQFLDEQRSARRLCVRIVHGRGTNSKDGQPVLKLLADRLLRRRADVLAFRTARAEDGGAGAVLVLLRPR